MTKDEIRLELLKLTYAHGRTSAEAVGRAKELEEFVFADEIARQTGAPAPAKRGRPPKTGRQPPLFG